jgi:hypothetical protein
MFMRYRGGGIGHKYMREIETKFENMSRVHLHGKQPHHKPRRAKDQAVESLSDSDDGQQGSPQLGMPTGDRITKPMTGSLGEGEYSDESGDEDYVPSETGSSGEEGIDSQITSDFDYDSYGLADP